MKNILFLALSTALLFISDKLAAQLPARSAYEFVESVGVCTHFDYTNTNYVQQFDSVKTFLNELGVRYFRDRAAVHTDHGNQRCLEIYNEYGIKNVAVFNPRSNKLLRSSAIDKMISRAADTPQMIAAFEGPNEYDNNHPSADTNWVASLYAFQDSLYTKTKNHPETALQDMPVLGPSTTFYRGVASMGDFSEVCDYYNIHAYPGARAPTHPLSEYLTEVPKYNGDIAIYATETGYHTALKRGPRPHYPINEASEAKYLPRLFLEYFRAGVVKTFSYEFMNLQANPGNDNMKHNFGLIREDLTKKPAFYAVKNMLTILKDESDAHPPQSLDYTLSGATDNVEQLLLQKSDSTFYLVLWQDVSVWDRKQQIETANPEAALTLTFHQSVLQSKVYLPYHESNPSAPLAPIAVQDNPSSVEISLPDHVMIVEITPTPVPVGPPPVAGLPIFEEDFVQGPYLDRWIIKGRDWLFGYRLDSVADLGYAVKPRNVANGEPLITRQSFTDSSYILETTASGFKATYQRQFRFTFGQTDLTQDRGYILRYQPPTLGRSTLTLGRSEGNFYFPTVLDEVPLVLKDQQIYGFRVVRYQSGLIQVYLDHGEGYGATPVLQAVDTTYATLAHFGWGVVTQTTGESFYVFKVNAYQTSEEKPANRVRIRAKGSQGNEQMSLLVDGQVVKSWTVATAPDNYFYQDYRGGSISVRFDNDTITAAGADRNLGINYVEVCGTKYESNAPGVVRTGCGVDNDQGFAWLWCSGSFDFGNLNCTTNARQARVLPKTTASGLFGNNSFVLYPNPATEQLTVQGSEDYRVVIYDLRGRPVMRHEHLKGQTQLDIRHLRPGVYVVRMNDGRQEQRRQRLVVE